MAAGVRYPVYVRIPLYRNADDALAKRNVSSYITPTGSEVEGPGKFYINNAVSDSYRPAVAIWFIHDTYGGAGYAIGWVNDTQNAAPTTPSAPNGTLGSELTISLPRVNAGFKHTLKYRYGGAIGTIATGAETSHKWTPPISLASQFPSATAGSCTITCETYSGTTLVGTKTIIISLAIPTSVVPVINSVTVTENVAGLATQFGAFVRHKSKVRIRTTSAGAYGSTIRTVSVGIDGKTYSGADVTSSEISAVGSFPSGVVVTVTDSRGRTAQRAEAITIVDWHAPRISGFSAIRTNASGTEADDGWNARISYNYNISPVGNKNYDAWRVDQWTGSSWAAVSNGTGYSANTNFLSGAIFSPDQSHRLRLVVTDYFTSSTSEFTLPTSSNVMDFKANKKGLAIGKASELDALEVAWPAHFTGASLTHNGSQVLTKDDVIFMSLSISSVVGQSYTSVSVPYPPGGSGSTHTAIAMATNTLNGKPIIPYRIAHGASDMTITFFTLDATNFSAVETQTVNVVIVRR